MPGYDYVNGDPDPSDDNGHGTAVAGVVGADSNNGIGVAGYCWGCRLMPVKVLDAGGIGSTTALAQGMVWATDHGARVINVSLGSSTDDATVAAAAQYARMHGVLVVAAAGNNSSSILEYPAALPDVVSVSASDERDQLYGFSNFGSALAAPGDNSTTARGGGYESFLGTSSAAPVVSGIAALGFSADPDATPGDVEEALKAGAVAVSGVVFGRADAYGTVHALAPWLASSAPTPTGLCRRYHRHEGVVGDGRPPTSELHHLGGRSRLSASQASCAGGGRKARLSCGSIEEGVPSPSPVGARSLRLRAPVRRGTYRLVLTSSGRKPVRFELTVAYPRAR